MKQILFLSFCTLFMGALSSCGSNNNTPKAGDTQPEIREKPLDDIGRLHKLVMFFHDETMSKMDSIMLLKTGLKKNLADNKTLNKTEKDSIETNINRLQKANDAMMDWMHAFKNPDEKEDHDVAMKYLKDQFDKISSVKNQVRQSLDLANAALKSTTK